MPRIDNRKKYWNEQYYLYWRARVEESHQNPTGKSKLVKSDTKVPGNAIYEMFLNEGAFHDGKILDAGCAWGRMFTVFADRNFKIYGIDISKKMIEVARKKTMSAVVEVREAELENIPYADNFFDFVCCLGTFDATYQDRSLKEMLRVARIGGKVMITGKNWHYFKNDNDAWLAEQGARNKGEPNHFTDVLAMLEQLKENGQQLQMGFYFLKRGDFGKGIYLKSIPEQFYEFCIIIEKRTESFNFVPFYSDKSKLYYQNASNPKRY